MLLSIQKQMIKQAKCTYYPLGKALEEQIKTTEEQEERKIKEIQDQGEIKTIKNMFIMIKIDALIPKQKEIFDKLVNKNLEEITNLDKEVNPDNLIYRYIGFTADARFNEFDHAFGLLDKISDDKIRLADAKIDQAEF